MAEGSKNGIFAFDRFRLDVGKLMLYRDGEEVLIPPKVGKTLAVLVESAGSILSKDELIERVWQDSIVEESNLTQYLYLLRKTLGTMPDGRPYIETLRRRGYRFNGEVTRASAPAAAGATASPARLQPEPSPSFSGVERDGNVLRVVDWRTQEAPAEMPEREAEPVEKIVPAAPPRGNVPRLAIAALLLVAAAGGALIVFWPRLMPAATSAEPIKEIYVTKLTNGAVPHGATISPDGNVFVYHEVDGETSRMYIQQTGQASRIEIASTTEKVFATKTFSPDAQFVYYVAYDKKSPLISLYRIPAMGGASIKILDNIHGPVSFSPDGKEIALIRRNVSTGESSIIIAANDGRAERVFLHRKQPVSLTSSVSWSPDGKLIAFGELSLEKVSSYTLTRLKFAEVATGRVSEISQEDWDNILRLSWTTDGAGIAMIGTRMGDGYSTRRDQVYFVSFPRGVSYRVTTDGNRHEPDSLGVTKKGEVLAVPANRSSQVWVMDPNGDAATATQLTKGTSDGRAGLGPLPGGRFAYLARNADEISIMLANADGSELKQLPTGFQFVEELRSDPLGRFMVFATLIDRKNHLFRIDIESETVKQLTFGERSIDSTISPDGKFLVYDSIRLENDREVFSILRIPTEGGDPVTLKSSGCFIPTFSPDGSLISCVDSDNRKIVIISAADGSELERHPLPLSATWNFGIGWTPDGTGLIYIVSEKGTSNLWVQPRDGSRPRSMTNFANGTVYRYAFTPDGSKLYIARGYPTQDAVLIRNFR